MMLVNHFSVPCYTFFVKKLFFYGLLVKSYPIWNCCFFCPIRARRVSSKRNSWGEFGWTSLLELSPQQRLIQRSTIKPLEKRGTGKSSFSLPSWTLTKHASTERDSSDTWILRFPTKTVQWCCQVFLRHQLCIRTFCGPRRLFPCHPVYTRLLPRTRAFWWKTCWGSADLPPSCTGAFLLQAHLFRLQEPQLWITLLRSTSPGLHLCQKDQARHKRHLPIMTQITWNLEWMQFSRQQHATVGFSLCTFYVIHTCVWMHEICHNVLLFAYRLRIR